MQKTSKGVFVARRYKQVTYSSHPNRRARHAHAKGERQFRTYDTSLIRPKKSKAPVIVAIILAIIIVVLAVFGFSSLLRSCSSTGTLAVGSEVDIVVVEGSNTQQIGQQLQDAGVISSINEFTRKVQDANLDATLQAGTYTFTGGMTINEVVSVFRAGPKQEAGFTVPEGYTIQNIASALSTYTNGRISAESFIAQSANASVYALDFPFLAEVGTNSLEGFLFPKTYQIDAADTADSVVRKMLEQYRSETATLNYTYPTAQGLSAYDVLKLASIVEKEADDNTRARVASVFYNRLASDRPYLESDATTAYEVGGDPTAEQVHADTPYSTYTHEGLPPTPICSPSLDSLLAVCAPEDTSYMYFYFEPNDSGGLTYYFSETYEEHQSTYQ